MNGDNLMGAGPNVQRIYCQRIFSSNSHSAGYGQIRFDRAPLTALHGALGRDTGPGSPCPDTCPPDESRPDHPMAADRHANVELSDRSDNRPPSAPQAFTRNVSLLLLCSK